MPPIYQICAASKSEERAWRALTVSHGNKLRHYYDYVSWTPLNQDAERVFTMKGPYLGGVWECEVGAPEDRKSVV